MESIQVAEVISALSYALDLTEGQPSGHSVRSCVIGMLLARELGLPDAALGDLYYALLLKDAGCSSNASRIMQIMGADDIGAKRDVKTTDWTRIGWESVQFALSHVRPGAPFLDRMRGLFQVAVNQKKTAKEMVQIRCERGATIARRIGLRESTAEAIHSLDELWSGCGQPNGLRGEEIPLFSRIMNLAQTADVFYTAYGAKSAFEVVRDRSGRWFDPRLVRVFCTLSKSGKLWPEVENAGPRVLDFAPAAFVLEGSEATIDNICLAFAGVIDAKSPFTYRHSTGVAGAAVAIARTLSMPETDVTLLRRAALLHDVGKLSVSNTILDKPDKLNGEEWAVVRGHPRHSLEILSRIPGFGKLSELAASHHEKLDGSGYFRNMSAEQLSLPARVLVVADIYDALAANRPYRDAMPREKVFGILRADAPKCLDSECVEALERSSEMGDSVAADLMRLSVSLEPAQQHEHAAVAAWRTR